MQWKKQTVSANQVRELEKKIVLSISACIDSHIRALILRSSGVCASLLAREVKTDMQAWLQKRNIYFTHNMTKVQLWSVIKPLIHGEQKCYVVRVDELLQSHGHQILRLPAYHCQYNAIGAFSKNYYNKHIKGSQHTENKVTKVWKEGLDRFTPQMWQNSVNHCQKLIKEDWKKYMGNFSLEEIPPIIISLAESDDSDSDFDSDSDDE